MARGRILNRSVSLSIKFNRLIDDTCRLLATWCIPHLDYRGVFYADPEIVKGQVMPMHTSLTPERIEHYLQDMQRVGLVVLFTHDERRWMFWPGFSHNQTIRAGKERSEFPLPPADGQPKETSEPNEQPPTDGPQADYGRPMGGLRAKNSSINEMKGNEKKDSAAEPARASFDEHNTSTSNSTEPPADSAPTMTPIPQTDKARAGNFANLIFERALKVKENPALAQVRKWGLDERIEAVCIDYVELAVNTPAMQSDKGKWAKGAKDILELFRASGRSYSRAWMEKAIKHATFTHSHPMALDTAFRDLFKLGWRPADAPADDGTVHAGWVQNDKGEMVEQRKRVATHA